MKQIKILTGTWFLVVLGMAVNTAFAGADLSVKIDSFTSVDQQHHLGELCGTVTINPESKIGGYVAVTVMVDPKTGNPGFYNTLASQQGSFCTLILSYTGTASATAWVPSSAISASSEVAQIRGHR